VSLRFPRLVRIREDKGPEDITRDVEIIEFYKKQPNLNMNVLDDEDDE